TGGGAMDETLVAEQVRGSPKQLDAGALLLLLEHCHDLVKIGVGLRQVGSLGRHVAVMEAIERGAKLLNEFEGDADSLQRHVDRVRAVLPGANGAPGTEGVGSASAQGVPIRDREPEV